MNTTPVAKLSLLLASLCLALSPIARAVDPPPDGGYPNFNTAEGEDALFALTTGSSNAAVGFRALFRNTIGNSNTAIGNNALVSNTRGSENTASGIDALANNTTANENTATGAFALVNSTTGSENTANGANALENNVTGSSNTAIGDLALVNATGDNNIALGASAGFNLAAGDNNIYIGHAGAADDDNTIRIGTKGIHRKASIAGINGVTVPGGVAVLIDNNGRLGTVTSSARHKDAIQPMEKASEAIFLLKPVTFCYKDEFDPEGIPQFGLVAEDVEKVDPDLVARDEQDKAYSVRYEAVNAMLLNEFLKEHRKVEKQGQMIRRLEAAVAELKATSIERATQPKGTSARTRRESPSGTVPE